MTIFQRDIVGGINQMISTKEKKAPGGRPAATGGIAVSLKDGLGAEYAESWAMLVHRMLERKLIFSGLKTEKQKRMLLEIVQNEIDIKKGSVDPCTATRDSLIKGFVVKQ
jgi:hypothetical protein